MKTLELIRAMALALIVSVGAHSQESVQVSRSAKCSQSPSTGSSSTIVTRKTAVPSQVLVDVSCSAVSPPQTTANVAPAPAPTPATGKEGSADKPEQLGMIVIGEAIALGLIFLIAVGLVFVGARLVSPKKIFTSDSTMMFRQHWGGFGAESSGWHLSATLGACAAGLLLVCLGATLAGGTLVVLHDHQEQQQDRKKKDESGAAAEDVAKRLGASGAGAEKPGETTRIDLSKKLQAVKPDRGQGG